MFALALVDTKERTYLLARDRLGQKPLYYYVQADELRFASELKALLAWPDAPRVIDPQAVAQYLAFDYLPHERTIFKSFDKLPPGSYLVGRLDKPESIQVKSYWQIGLNGEDGQSTLTSNQIEELHDLLTDATRIRLRSDVPVGIFLSGGIDSGLIAALAADSPEGGDLRTLTVGFTEKDYDETALAQATAEHVGLEQCVIQQQPDGLASVDRLAWFFDEPFGDPSALPTFSLCRVASEHATVFLAGDGGDEAFGGYRKYTRTLRYRLTHAFPAPVGLAIETVSKFLPLLSLLRYRVARKSLPDGGFSAAFNRTPVDPVFQLVLPQSLQTLAGKVGQPWWDTWRRYPGPSMTARWQELDYALYLPDDILVKIDRASMAHSIELRSPFFGLPGRRVGCPSASRRVAEYEGRKTAIA
jgi:asparagine synthase (glutamine-hydrolysing)